MVHATDVFLANWLRDVGSTAVEKLRGLTQIVNFADRATVYSHGGEQKWLWGVRSGQVRVHVTLNEMDPTLGHIHQTGAWFGESEPLLGVAGLVEMQAAGETSTARINFADFRMLANEHPELWEALARLTSMNQVLAMTAANDLALRNSRMRMAAVLLRLSGHRASLQQTTRSAAIPASQREVAKLANVAMSTASNHLREFANAELIRAEYGRIVVLAPEQLKTVIQP